MRGAAHARITIPRVALDRIPPTALPRSSIVVSDEPLSRETNYRTEFVAVLSGQPQGGFVARKPTADMPVATRGDDFFGFLFQRNLTPPTGDSRLRSDQYYRQGQQRWR